VQYHVALHLLSGLRALGGDARFARDLLVVADPVFNGGDPRAGGPSAGDLPRFARLPETGGLARRLAARSAGATVLSGADASTARLRSEPLAEYRRIVLATHAEASPDSPDLTTKDGKRLAEPILVLSRGLAPRDGVVSLTELGALGLRAEMVALVACETGRGRMIAGEGTVSLGRAMLGAGAQSVLVSLWRVDELASTMLVDRFFEVLYDGTTHPAEALRRARQAVRSVPGFDHPFYWAGFVLLGGATG
jgi:CHAT domain-containing protein